MELNGIRKLAVIFDREGFELAENGGNAVYAMRRNSCDYEIYVQRLGEDSSRIIKVPLVDAQHYRNNDEFCRWFEHADDVYEEDKRRLDEKRTEENERRVEKRKGIMKKTLGTIVAGMALMSSVWAGWNHFTSPEFKRGRELNMKAMHILPDYSLSNRQASYSLNGENITVRNKSIVGDSYAMEIDLSGITFASETFVFPNDDARNLETIYVDGRKIPVEETNNPVELQTQYEQLIERIYDAKITKEKSDREAEQRAIEQAKQKIQKVTEKI